MDFIKRRRLYTPEISPREPPSLSERNEFIRSPDEIEDLTSTHEVDPPLLTFPVFLAPNGCEICGICLNLITEPAQVYPCAHLFCKDCIIPLLQSNPRCPFCDRPVRSVLQEYDNNRSLLVTSITYFNSHVQWDHPNHRIVSCNTAESDSEFDISESQTDDSVSSSQPLNPSEHNEFTRLYDERVADLTLTKQLDGPSSIICQVFPALDDCDTCPICLELITEPIRLYPCLHLFCKDCIIQWLQSKTTCPFCRKIVFSVLQVDENNNSLIETGIGCINTDVTRNSLGNLIFRRVTTDFDFKDDDMLLVFVSLVQPSRSEFYLGEYIRHDFPTCNFPYNPIDHNRIRRWIIRDTKAIFAVENNSRTEFVSNRLMVTLLYGTTPSAIPLSKFMSPEFKKVCFMYFGLVSLRFCDELFHFAESGQTVECYDCHTYYRQRYYY